VDCFRQILDLLRPAQGEIVLPAPATEADLDDLQQRLGLLLPAPFLDVFRVCNGGPSIPHDPCVASLFYSYRLMSTRELLETADLLESTRRQWGRVDPREPIPSVPPAAVQDWLSSPLWLAFATDGAGGYLALDFGPGPNGVAGQVINFGRDDTVHFQLATDFRAFLARVVDDYKQRRFHHVFGYDLLFVDSLIMQHQKDVGA
jgi:internalin A